MGLDKLNLDTAVQTDIATQILQTALAVPDGTKEKICRTCDGLHEFRPVLISH